LISALLTGQRAPGARGTDRLLGGLVVVVVALLGPLAGLADAAKLLDEVLLGQLGHKGRVSRLLLLLGARRLGHPRVGSVGAVRGRASLGRSGGSLRPEASSHSRPGKGLRVTGRRRLLIVEGRLLRRPPSLPAG
jgi:hypothetical protein